MEPTPEYDIGDAPVLTGEFRARGTNALTDPTLASVTVRVRTSRGVVTTYTTSSVPAVTRASVGVYTIQLPKIALTDPPGDWHYRFEGDGDLIDAGESRFVVKPSAFAVDPALPANQWVSGQSLLSDPRLDKSAMPPEVSLDMCAQSATEYLYKRTGQRFRTVTTTVRPNVANICGCAIEDCWSSRELSLPGPVTPESVVVVIEGVTLPESAYTLYDGHLLVREDGGFWPMCSHLAQPSNLAWSITFTRGELPGPDGILACRELAIHIAIALSGKPSKLPARATGVQRRGTSMNLLRGLKRTGIPLVDDYLDSTNPNGLTGRGSVMSPDTIRLSSS